LGLGAGMNIEQERLLRELSVFFMNYTEKDMSDDFKSRAKTILGNEYAKIITMAEELHSLNQSIKEAQRKIGDVTWEKILI
jgi:hypothetical protein